LFDNVLVLRFVFGRIVIVCHFATLFYSYTFILTCLYFLRLRSSNTCPVMLYYMGIVIVLMYCMCIFVVLLDCYKLLFTIYAV
jgi:hypothetical protein